MNKKSIILTVVFMFVLPGVGAVSLSDLGSLVLSEGNTLYVGGTGPGNYSSIQAAVDDAVDGDTVFVFSHSSPYLENVVVETSLCLIGEDKNCTVIDGMNNDDPLWIKTSSVSVSGFTLMNCPKTMLHAGIYVTETKWGSNEFTILADITISDCIIKNNKRCGIRMDQAQHVDISDCFIADNDGNSILISDSSQVMVKSCEIHGNGEELGPGTGYSGGISTVSGDFGGCFDVEISRCNISHNKLIGIAIGQTHRVDIHHNIISHNSWRGIQTGGLFNFSSDIVIRDNVISGNGEGRYFHCGIFIQGCRDLVTIEHNMISSNHNTGIYLLRASQNKIVENNILGHERDGYFDGFCFLNRWDGNYWGDSAGLDGATFPWKIIKGNFFSFIPWVNFDRHPAKEPHVTW